MSLASTTLALTRLREEPQWKLLAANNAPIIIAILETMFGDRDEPQPSAKFHADLKEALDELTHRGYECPRTAQEYAATWLVSGWLERTFPAGAAEEQYAPSVAARAALRFITGARAPRATATASRLSTVLDRATQLVDLTDTDQSSRLARLHRERDALDREIALVERGAFDVLPDADALEAVRDLIHLAEGITGDFHRVQDTFATLNRQIRTELLTNDDNRGVVLDQMFDAMDVLSTTDAGRSFDAFWEIISPTSEQRDTLPDTISTLLARPFSGKLAPAEQRFLRRLMPTLLQESNTVLQMRGQFSSTLRDFVQSKAFLETRRMQQVLREAAAAATEAAQSLRFTESIDHDIVLSSLQVRSVSQYVLHDPQDSLASTEMLPETSERLDVSDLTAMAGDMDIDWGSLRGDLLDVLDTGATVSIRDLLAARPSRQGVASVVGYIVLGTTVGAYFPEQGRDVASWRESDGTLMTLHIPMCLFDPELSEAIRAG